MSFGDPGCLAALTIAIGHEPPFTDAELAQVRSLAIRHARDLTPIEGCTALTHVRIIASELRSLRSLHDLSELEDIEIHCCVVKSLGGLAELEKLRRLDVMFTSAEDALQVMGTSRSVGTLIGNPWDEVSWEALKEEAERDDRLIELPPDWDWKRTRKLWTHARACYGSVASSYGMVVRPGLPTLTRHVYDALHVSGGAVEDALNEGMSLEALFARFVNRSEAPDLSTLARARTLGYADDALAWIAASSLSAPDKAALEQFVKRFPSVKFLRSSESVIDRVTATDEVPPPEAYRTMTTILDGWMPHARNPAVRFDRFEKPSPRGSASAMSYVLGLSNHGGDIKAAMNAAGFVNVGAAVESPDQMLAMRGSDPQVYEYNVEEINDAISEKRDIAASIRPVFRSYAAMLGHVISIHPGEGAPVTALNAPATA